MRLFTGPELLEVACKASNKFGMYINVPTNYLMEQFPGMNIFQEIAKAAPYLIEDADHPNTFQIIADGEGYLLFDTEEEMNQHFWQTVGDDGPTETNPYNGPVRIYALTCNNDGQLENENT